MIRLDFVSNSSSSSHIVIAQKINNEYLPIIMNIKKIYVPSKDYGTHQFGWEWIDYKDFWSKLNFCAIQLHDLKKYCKEWNQYDIKYYREYYKKYRFDKCLKMLQKVCKEKFNLDVKLKLEYEKDEEWEYYIDHQSSIVEARNMDMFENEDTLYRFLGNERDSYIEGGNDNDCGGY